MVWGAVIMLAEGIEEEVALEPDGVGAGEEAHEDDGRCSEVKKT